MRCAYEETREEEREIRREREPERAIRRERQREQYVERETVRAKAKSSLHHLKEKSGEIEERRERDVEGVKEFSVMCGIEREKKILCD